jgi:hypothetical protein
MSKVGALAKFIKETGKNLTPSELKNYLFSEVRRGALPKGSQDYYDTFDPKVYYHATTEDINKFNPFEDPIYGAYSREGGVDSRGATYFTSDPFVANQVLKARRQNELEDIRDQAEEVYDTEGMQEFLKENPNFEQFIQKNPKLFKNDPFQLYEDIMQMLVLDNHNLPSNPSRKMYTQGSQIYPVKIRTKNVFDYDNNDHIEKLENKILAQFSDESEEFDRLGRVKVGDWLTLEEPYVQEALRDLGFNGYRTNEPGTIGLLSPDEGDVRSLYAKFDPKEAKSGEILASIVPYASVGTIGALAGLDEGT